MLSASEIWLCNHKANISLPTDSPTHPFTSMHNLSGILYNRDRENYEGLNEYTRCVSKNKFPVFIHFQQ